MSKTVIPSLIVHHSDARSLFYIFLWAKNVIVDTMKYCEMPWNIYNHSDVKNAIVGTMKYHEIAYFIFFFFFCFCPFSWLTNEWEPIDHILKQVIQLWSWLQLQTPSACQILFGPKWHSKATWNFFVKSMLSICFFQLSTFQWSNALFAPLFKLICLKKETLLKSKLYFPAFSVKLPNK